MITQPWVYIYLKVQILFTHGRKIPQSEISRISPPQTFWFGFLQCLRFWAPSQTSQNLPSSYNRPVSLHDCFPTSGTVWKTMSKTHGQSIFKALAESGRCFQLAVLWWRRDQPHHTTTYLGRCWFISGRVHSGRTPKTTTKYWAFLGQQCKYLTLACDGLKKTSVTLSLIVSPADGFYDVPMAKFWKLPTVCLFTHNDLACIQWQN